jgi:hypothetical protein
MNKLLRDVFPPIYRPLLPDFFDRPTIVETRATCDDCAMCDRGKPSPVPMEYFQPDLKCCTYTPHLPNYLVGAVFSDDDPALAEGKARLRKKIASRMAVTPERMSPPRKQSLVATMAADSGFFGRSYAIVCPYLDGEKGLCTVWKHREGVCSTYYCKYTHGALGYAFWRSLKEYLGYVEVGLARWAARSIDPTVTEPQVRRGELTLEDLEDRAPNPEAYTRYWGKWEGREEEFYVECHARVKTLTREEFDKIVLVKPDAKGWLDATIKRYEQALSPVLPTHLVRNKEMRERPAGETIILSTYNRFDSFAIGKELYDVLGMFDPNETLEQNLARLDAEHGIEMHPDLLRELYVQNVLVPPVKPEEPKPAVEAPKIG